MPNPVTAASGRLMVGVYPGMFVEIAPFASFRF
jgi:hypothetical protein